MKNSQQIKILMQNRPRGQWTGGDMVKLDKIMVELINLGYDVTYNGQPLFTPALLLQDFDVVHTWNFTMEWTKYQVWAAKKHKCKLVCSMTYHETDRYTSYDNQQIMLDSLDMAIYETPGEIERVKRHLITRPEKTIVIPNGVDSWWFGKEVGKVPFEDYVLTVGRIEPSKGQLEASIACKELGKTYIMIGEITDESYFEKCIANGAIIYPSLPQKELRKWYKNCSVYIQPSVAETWGMAVDEAGTQGVPVVISTGFERKNIPEVIMCEHANVVTIKDAIGKAFIQKKNIAFRDALKKRTWKKVAQEYAKIYKKICKENLA